MDTPPQELVFLSTYLLTLLPPTLPLASDSLLAILVDRLVPAHWHPDSPERGSGYRAISFEPCRRDRYVDPVLVAAAQSAGWTSQQLRKRIALDTGDVGRTGWTVFVDPGCVCFRGGGPALREVWGSLPYHLKPSYMFGPPIRSSTQFRPDLTVPMPVVNSNSPPFSIESRPPRAAPLVPSSSALRNATVVKVGVIPPTPHASREDAQSSSKASSASPSRAGPLGDDANNTYGAGDSEVKIETLAPLQLLAPFSLKQTAGPIAANVHVDTQGDDPFHRPSSRSSSGSGSEEYASDASLSSNRSSATSDATTIADSSPQYQLKASAVPFTPSQGIVRQRPSQMALACHRSVGSLDLPPSPGCLSSGSTSPLAQSLPTSPKKQSNHSRARFSAAPASHGLILKGGPGTVTEHSGGKVGVMGGGVLLGVPKSLPATASGDDGGNSTNTSGASHSDNKVRRRGGRRSRGGQQYSVHHHQGPWTGAGLSISSIASFASAGSTGSLY